MSPEYVRPYVRAQKNDDRDAEAIAEAATRPTMRFVELKTQDQLDIQTLHRSQTSNRKLFSSPQHGPGNPGQLVGERDDGDIMMNAGDQSLQPSAELVSRSAT